MSGAAPSSRERSLWWSAGLAAGAAMTGYAVWRAWVDDADLVGFHQDILRVWKAGELPGAFGIRYYLPAVAVLLAPLMLWSVPFSAGLTAVVNVALLGWIVARCGKRYQGVSAARVPLGLLRVWPVVLVLPFAVGTIALGQVNLFVLGLCLLGWDRTVAGKPVWAGLAVGLAGVLKLYPLIFVGYWLVRRQWREAFVAVVGFTAIAGGLSLAAFGWEGTVRAHRQWFDRVRGEARYGGETDGAGGDLLFRHGASSYLRANNQSLAAVVARWTTRDRDDAGEASSRFGLVNLEPLTAKWAYRAMAGVLLLGLMLQAWRHRGRPPMLAEWSGWLIAIVAFVPIFWTHYFVLLLPALGWLGVVVWHDRQSGARWAGTEVLQAAWLAGLPLLALPAARLAGVHAVLALVLVCWAMGPGARRERALLQGGGAG